MKIITMIPAYNEQDNIGNVLSKMPDFCHVIVIDDGSTDKTAEITRQYNALVYSHKKNQGVGAAFKTGLMAALEHDADIIVNMDADGQMNPEHIPYLIHPILKKEADVVITTRFERDMQQIPSIKRFGNKFVTFLINILTGEKLKDSTCGFRAYSREAAKKINVFGKFTYTQEVIMDLADKGQKIKEISLPVLPERTIGKSRVVKNFLDYGFKAGTIILRSMRDYNPLKFFGIPGFLFILAGLSLDTFVIIMKIFFNQSIFEHHTWKLFFGSLLLFLGTFCIIFALLADMYSRHRKMMEEMLYLLR